MKIYRSAFRQKEGFFASIVNTFKDTFKYRWFIILLIKKHNKLVYQQDVLGFFWLIVMPIIPMTAYVLLASIKVFNTVEDMPFVFYIVMGMFVWMLMSSIITKVMLSVKNEKNILKTSRIPMFIFMVSKLGEILFDSSIRLLAVVCLIFWYSIDVSLSSLVMFILLIIPIVLISFTIGMLAAIMDIFVQDTRKVLDIVFRYGLFISSVIFPFPTEGVLGLINNFNIFNTYVNSLRDILYYGTINNLSVFLYTTIVGLIAFFIVIRLTYILDYKVREYL